MLPKPDKSKKKTDNQLDLVDTISSADKVEHKRRYLIISLSATIGLSLLFWGYRSFSSFLQHPKAFKLNLPRLSLPAPDLDLGRSPDLLPAVKAVLAGQLSSWSIYVQTLPASPESIVWSYNYPSPDIDPILSSLHPSDNQRLLSVLPHGVELNEQLVSADPYEHHLLISSPHRQLLILFKSDSAQNIDSVLPALIENLYWEMAKL